MKARRAAVGRVSTQEARFIEITLQTGSPVGKKQALQQLCNLIRRGFRLIAPLPMKGLVLQCLTDDDLKVRRWAFNSLALLGTAADVTFIMPVLESNRGNTDVFEAGLTALANILPKNELQAVLATWGVAMSPATVFALAQQSDDFGEEMSNIHLRIDSATASELKSATLLIGLQKAPDTLFSDRFPVCDVIGDLNLHEDRYVSQYSFWAAVEHPDLGFSNMRVRPREIADLPPNVQGWAYRVLLKDRASAKNYYELVIVGSESEAYEIREGVAIGLKDVYYDSLDTTVIDWLADENDSNIKGRLLEHMAAQVEKSGAYREEVLTAYRSTGPQSALRARLEAACKSDSLSLEFRKIELQTGDPDLFSMVSGPFVTNNNQTFTGQTFTGISGSGTGNTGNVQIISIAEAQKAAAPVLDRISEGLNSAAPTPENEAAKKDVEAARAVPSKGNMEKIVGWLKLAKDGGQAAVGLGHAAGDMYNELHTLMQHLPAHWG
jgi:hypothetical protein